MKAIKLISVVALYCSWATSYAQDALITYVGRDGQSSTKEHCYIYRAEKQRYAKRDSIVSYYCSTNKPMKIVQVDKDGKAHGESLTFYEEGGIAAKATYEKDVIVDTLTHFYRDGKIHYQKYYGSRKQPVEKLANYWSRSGRRMITNGEGTCQCQFPEADGTVYMYAGSVRNGYREGEWQVSDNRGRLVKVQQYSKGVLLKERLNEEKEEEVEDGVFMVVEESATFPGGMTKFNEFVDQNRKYPQKALDLGIHGKVFVEFTVEVDGAITDVHVIKGIGAGCDEESVRLITISPKWKPAKRNGKVVKQKMVMPITFNLPAK